ncbi:MAG: LysE family translocator [Candidatus Dormibacteraceae bacterium]
MGDLVDARLLAYAGVVALLVMAPGPDMALVSRNALRGGARLVLPTVLGVAVGILGWSLASALGVATLLERSAMLFALLRLAGAAYLCVLGVLALRSAWRHGARRTALAAAGAPPRSRRGGFLQGLTGNLLNPKAGVIFLTLVPQFLRPGDPPGRVILMIAIFEALLVTWLLIYGRGLARLGQSRFGRRAQRWLEAASGTVLCALGLEVAWQTWRSGA